MAIDQGDVDQHMMREAQEEYTEANRAVKNSVRKTEKENFIENLAKEAEDASALGKHETSV